MDPLHIAVVDDELEITRVLGGYLAGHGYRVSALSTGRELLQLAAEEPPALVLLDLGLPGEDGFAVARELRARYRGGLMFVTGRGDSIDKVVGLELGADDYVTKPFDLRELLARIKAVLRRTGGAADSAPGGEGSARIRFDGWSLDAGARELFAPDGTPVALTSGEFELLHALVQHAGRVLSRDFLLEETRGREAGPFDRTIDVLIARLRRKIEANPDEPRIIKTVRGAGYMFAPRLDRA
jgi:DNA-binding response OmpR family regulator